VIYERTRVWIRKNETMEEEKGKGGGARGGKRRERGKMVDFHHQGGNLSESAQA